MNTYNNNKKLISNTILRVFKKLSIIEGRTRNYGTDQPLFDAEVHIIKAVREHEGIHITALAEMLNVTKGAVSQTLMKLQKKDMVVKEPDIQNQSRLCLKLTPKGEVAYENHEILHRNFDNVVKNILHYESEENKQFLFKFLSELDGELENFEE